MTAFLDKELTQFALCWRVERGDGAAVGFTAHDGDLTMDGFCYRSAPGIAPSSIEEGDPIQSDALEVAGALTADAISEADLRAGRWNGASVTLFAVDWQDPSQRLELLRGELGPVSMKRGSFSAELSGPGALLDRPIVEATSPLCRAELGDKRCRIDLAGRRTLAFVVGCDGETLTVDRAEPAANGWGGGRLRWLHGGNGGLSATILASAGVTLTLSEPPPFEVSPGTRVEIMEGCDKRFATCRDRFGNPANFRGEPHLPGMDLLTRYPGE